MDPDNVRLSSSPVVAIHTLTERKQPLTNTLLLLTQLNLSNRRQEKKDDFQTQVQEKKRT